MRSGRIAVLVLVALFAGVPPAVAHDDEPLVIGHRGAPGYLPDHTLAGYALAAKMGADYIEPDLVATKDGHLIARHEPNITTTTDVASHPEFASRHRTDVNVDGALEDGWFASDFTLKEIKTLRAVQPLEFRPHGFDGEFQIPTLEEVIALAKRKGVGIYPETKHPTYHQRLGLALEGRLVNALKKAGWNKKSSPVFIQSFEQSNLKQLNRMTDVRLVQLVDAADVRPDGSLEYYAPWDRPYDWTASGDPRLLARTFGFFATDAGLAEIRTYADGIGPWKRYIVSTAAVDINGDGTVGDENGDGATNDGDRKLLPPTTLIQRAHRKGLLIHTWTFRDEDRYLAYDYGGRPLAEYRQFFRLGIDGVFSDFTGTATLARWLYVR
jgi:glycerophosphoryl diester phosphodiesterase